MEYLQYRSKFETLPNEVWCFKPYYKWNTFNTVKEAYKKAKDTCFKPYYKWNTFNTDLGFMTSYSNSFGFKPYYKWNTFNTLLSINLINSNHF